MCRNIILVATFEKLNQLLSNRGIQNYYVRKGDDNQKQTT